MTRTKYGKSPKGVSKGGWPDLAPAGMECKEGGDAYPINGEGGI